MVFQIEIAKKTIQINSIYGAVYQLCKNYWVKRDTSDFVVYMDDQTIEKERKLDSCSDKAYLECLAVYRQISEKMLEYDIFLMHGSVIAVGNEAFMIAAKSGTGKTTRTDTWLRCIENSYIVNGDKPLIIIEKDSVLACGTPWCGKERQETNMIVPLKAIFFLERSNENYVHEIPFSEAFISLLTQTYKPESTNKIDKTIQLLNELNGKVRFFRFCSNLDEEAVKMAYAAATSTETTLQK